MRDVPGVSVRSAVARLHPAAGSGADVSRLADLAARLLRTPSALVSLVDDAAMAVGAGGDSSPMIGVPLAATDSFCAATAEHRSPLSIADTLADPRWAQFPAARNGSARSYLGVPLLADSGEVVGAMCVYGPEVRQWTPSDVGLLVELARAVASELELAALTRDYELSRARWDLAIAAAGVGTFDWDLRTQRLVWDAALVELFGYDDDDRFDESIAAFVARLHEDDVARVEQAMSHAIETLGDFEQEYRVVLPGGEERRVQARGRALGSAEGAQRLVGAAWDVSRIRGAEDRAARILEAMPVGFIAATVEGTVTAMNTLAERLVWNGRREMVGHPLARSLPAPAGRTLADLCAQVGRTGVMASTEVQLSSATENWLEARVSPESGGVAIYLTDISARRAARVAAQRAADHDRAVAAALQDALLTTLPTPPHLQIAARYRAASARDRVGGDWYDALVGEGDTVTLVVGDVVGHDITAAAVMGQLRSMLRAFAWQGDATPAGNLALLDRAVADLHPGVLATVVTARIEPLADSAGGHLLRWSSAGHPPPLLLAPDGGVTVLGERSDVLIGVMPGLPRHDLTVTVAPGSVLLLFTDGLVEVRGEHLDIGLGRLAASLARHAAAPLPELLDGVLADTVGLDAGDDVAVLAVRFAPPQDAS